MPSVKFFVQWFWVVKAGPTFVNEKSWDHGSFFYGEGHCVNWDQSRGGSRTAGTYCRCGLRTAP